MPVPMQFGNGQGGAETGISMRLVWTNPAPASAFAAQTLALELGNYDAVIIFIRQSTANSEGSNCLAVMNTTTTVFTKGYANGTLFGRTAKVLGSGIEFGTGYSGATASTGYAIPVYIYGIKGIK